MRPQVLSSVSSKSLTQLESRNDDEVVSMSPTPSSYFGKCRSIVPTHATSGNLSLLHHTLYTYYSIARSFFLQATVRCCGPRPRPRPRPRPTPAPPG